MSQAQLSVSGAACSRPQADALGAGALGDGTCFGLAAEARGLLESSGSEGQAPGFPQAVLQHRFELGAQADHPAESHTG